MVIGAGPIGLVAALWFGKRSYRTVLIEQYAENKTVGKRAFNERHQQVGLNAESLNFLKDLDIVIWGDLKKMGSEDGDWINIPIYLLQNIVHKEIQNYSNIKILFDTTIESVRCVDPKLNCRLVLISGSKTVYGLSPRFVVIADGKHYQGTAETYFNFSAPCKVHLSTYGLVGMVDRKTAENTGAICLTTYTSDDYCSDCHPELKNMYIRMLGNMRERYIALGLADIDNTNQFLELSPLEIKKLLIEAYNRFRDKNMGEPEIDDFNEYSLKPIPINLDYRKETIKLFEGSSSIVTVEGDSGRKTSFFTGSGLNTGYKALTKLFNFCEDNETIIFGDFVNPHCMRTLDQKLLEKDQACINLSYALLVKGLHYVGQDKTHPLEAHAKSNLSSHGPNTNPVIFSIHPAQAEPSWFIHIEGQNLVGTSATAPSCIFEWERGAMKTKNVIVFDKNKIGVKIPKNAAGRVKISLQFDGNITVKSPIELQIIKIDAEPEINNVYTDGEWIYIDGKNFSFPCSVTIKTDSLEYKLKAYCTSSNSMILASTLSLQSVMSFMVETSTGFSKEFSKRFSPSTETQEMIL